MTITRSPLQRVTRNRPCPVCAHPDWCSVRSDGTAVICMRVRSGKEMRDGGHLHVLDGSEVTVAKALPARSVPETPRAARHICTAIYASLLREHLVLSEVHRAQLRARGLDDATIELNGYRSVPTELFASKVARALSEARDEEHDLPTYDLCGVPGFYRKHDTWQLTCGSWNYGIVIPVRDECWRVRALVIRRDDAAGSDNKYVWLSSKDRACGATPGTPHHFARPEMISETGEIIVTEGALKADIIAAFENRAVCGLASVTTFRETFGSELRSAYPKLRRVIIAFDADFRINRQVHRRLTQLTRNLKQSGFTVSVRSWKPEFGKGYDDYLLHQSMHGAQA